MLEKKPGRTGRGGEEVTNSGEWRPEKAQLLVRFSFKWRQGILLGIFFNGTKSCFTETIYYWLPVLTAFFH